MNIKRIKKRNILFTSSPDPSWDLNIHLILGDKNNYIIDTGLGTLDVKPISEFLKEYSKPLIIINTHYHWDHIWGNSYFKENTIISHKLARDIIEEKWQEMIDKNRNYINGDVELCLPNLVFEKELYFPEDKIRIIYTPGHTIDSISVIDEFDKVINIGDNIGDNMEEIIPSLFCEVGIYTETLKNYLKMDFDTCVSGHNVVLGKESIELVLSML